jgi:hypothetical protein
MSFGAVLADRTGWHVFETFVHVMLRCRRGGRETLRVILRHPLFEPDSIPAKLPSSPKLSVPWPGCQGRHALRRRVPPALSVERL